MPIKRSKKRRKNKKLNYLRTLARGKLKDENKLELLTLQMRNKNESITTTEEVLHVDGKEARDKSVLNFNDDVILSSINVVPKRRIFKSVSMENLMSIKVRGKERSLPGKLEKALSFSGLFQRNYSKTLNFNDDEISLLSDINIDPKEGISKSVSLETLNSSKVDGREPLSSNIIQKALSLTCLFRQKHGEVIPFYQPNNVENIKLISAINEGGYPLTNISKHVKVEQIPQLAVLESSFSSLETIFEIIKKSPNSSLENSFSSIETFLEASEKCEEIEFNLFSSSESLFLRNNLNKTIGKDSEEIVEGVSFYNKQSNEIIDGHVGEKYTELPLPTILPRSESDSCGRDSCEESQKSEGGRCARANIPSLRRNIKWLVMLIISFVFELTKRLNNQFLGSLRKIYNRKEFTENVTDLKKCTCSHDHGGDNKLLQRISAIEEDLRLLKEELTSLKSIKTQSVPPLPSVLLPPPPPPPPPLPATPIFNVINPITSAKVNRPKQKSGNAPVLPSITVDDLRRVQLRKTPAALKCDATTPKGPVVSVEMLRSVKLKSSIQRRKSWDRKRVGRDENGLRIKSPSQSPRENPFAWVLRKKDSNSRFRAKPSLSRISLHLSDALINEV